MKIFIATYGSRGDVQPYVALGKGLQQAGHLVILGTSERFREFVESNGLEYGYMSDDFLAIIDTDQGKELLENTTNFFGVVKQSIKLAKQVKPLRERMIQETWEIARSVRPDFILYHPKTMTVPHIAEKQGIGCALTTPIPLFVPTTEFSFLVFPPLRLGKRCNRWSYQAVSSLVKMSLGKSIRSFRQYIGLAPLKKYRFLKTADGRDIPVLHAHSEAVLSRPTDWPGSAFVTGYWFLDRADDWEPPRELQAFIEAGEPPVYVGFGSMAGRNPQRLARIVTEALQLAGVRGILASCWGGLKPEALPDSILNIEGAPHDWLFPRVSAVVHHGGAGTTAAGLRAGRPSVIVPFFADQPFWGRRVHALGAGPEPIPQKKLTAEKLAAAIKEAVSNPNMQKSAKAVGEKIRQEDGVGRAVAIIEKLMT